jgi:Zn-dependent peptidase ImmA (M78 family)
MPPGTARKAARTKARKVREEAGIGCDGPLPDVLALAEAQENLSVLIFESLADDVAGAAYCLGEQRLIFLNGSDHPVRLRFTLAHELGHHCFNHNARPDTLAGIVKQGSWIEVQANEFASELLMSEPAVAKWWEDQDADEVGLYELCDFACRFGVSALAAFYRLDRAELPMSYKALKADLDEGRHLAILDAADPYPDTISEVVDQLPRIPERFADSVFVKVARGDISVAAAARKLGRSATQLRAELRPLGLLPPT